MELVGAAAAVLAATIGGLAYFLPRDEVEPVTEVTYWDSSAYDANAVPADFASLGIGIYCQGPSALSPRTDLASCMMLTDGLGIVFDPCLRVRAPSEGVRGRFVCGSPDASGGAVDLWESEDLEPTEPVYERVEASDTPWMVKVDGRYCKRTMIDEFDPWINRFSCKGEYGAAIAADPSTWTTPGGVAEALRDRRLGLYIVGGDGSLTRTEQLDPSGVSDSRSAIAGQVVDVIETSPGVIQGRFTLNGSDFETVVIDEAWF